RLRRGFGSAARFFEGDASLIVASEHRVLVAQNSGATYQRNVRESLGKIAQLTLGPWVVLFGEKSEIVAEIEQAFEQFSRFFFAAEQLPAIRQPKRAGKEHAFGAWQSINTLF